MAIESINIIKKIAKRITSINGSDVVVLFDNVNPVFDIPSNTIISVNGFLKNLKGYSKIVSLQEAQLPDIRIDDSEPERRIKTLDVEWKSQRKQLDLLVSADGQEWIEVGSVSLIKQQGYPYRMYSLLDFFTDGLADEYGTNGKAGCRIVDVGYGLLTGSDLVTIHGSYLQEIIVKKDNLPTNIYLTCSGTGNNNDGGGDNSGGDNGGDNGDNNNGEEEVKRVFSSTEPTEKTEGLEWCELTGSNTIYEHWFWSQHPTTGELCWKSSSKEQIITQQGSTETKASFVISGAGDIYISSLFYAVNGNTSLQVILNKIANFSTISLSSFTAYGNNMSGQSIYHYHQGGNAIFQIQATPNDPEEYHLTSRIDYCVIRPIDNGGGGGNAP